MIESDGIGKPRGTFVETLDEPANGDSPLLAVGGGFAKSTVCGGGCEKLELGGGFEKSVKFTNALLLPLVAVDIVEIGDVEMSPPPLNAIKLLFDIVGEVGIPSESPI